jgi:hypothetical protein
MPFSPRTGVRSEQETFDGDGRAILQGRAEVRSRIAGLR